MKKFNYFFYLCIALTLVISSCSEEGDEVISTETVVAKAADEPDFVENDGSEEEEAIEELAPSELAQTKTYGSYYNYTLLKPSGLTKSDVEGLKCGETKTLPLLVGYYKKKVGTIEVSNDDENLYINVKANSYKYMKKVYFYIGNKADIPFYSNGYPKLKAFNYKAFPYYYGGQRRATYKIPLSSINSDCFEVVAYSKIYDAYSGCYYSAFGYDTNRTQKYYYSYYSGCYYFGDWVRSFDYCVEECKDPSIDAYGHKTRNPEHSFCFLDEGFSQWGWTNEFIYDNIACCLYKIQLYVNGDGCEYTVGEDIGYAELDVKRVDGVRLVDVKYVITNSAYALDAINFYIGADRYPTDGGGNPTTSTDFYTHKIDLNGETTYTISDIVWPVGLTANAYVIPNAKVIELP